MRNVLSIRGGGIRGIIPCCCLMKLESQLGGLTRDHFDFCGGTSTGALLTAAVAAGIPASQLLTVYTERSRQIFTPTGIEADAKRIVEGYMYDPCNLRDVLVSVLGTAAKWVINDCPIRVMISATAMDGHNWFFVKDNPRNSRTTGSAKLTDAAVASSCAPTYFDHWTMTVQGVTLNLFDGGAGGTSNPAYQVCVEMFEYDDFMPNETRLVALGTGYYPAPNDPPKGLIGTIGWVTSTLIDTCEDWVDQAAALQWPGVIQTINPLLPRDIDEADLSAVPTLLEIGQETATKMDWKQILA